MLAGTWQKIVWTYARGIMWQSSTPRATGASTPYTTSKMLEAYEVNESDSDTERCA